MTRYDEQRPGRTAPHVSIWDLRAVSGKTLEQVCEAVTEALGQPFTRGALSALENGHRGASAPVIRALEVAYGLREGAIKTDYQPRNRDIPEAVSA